ncbi:MAG TPA: hypothetical protein VJ111_12400 [Chitinophagaceae bacterium]|nr:hypothetical protein [Chitinophagaceae bacterium]
MSTVPERPAATENRRLYPGTIFNIRITAAESNNAIVIADYEAIPVVSRPGMYTVLNLF